MTTDDQNSVPFSTNLSWSCAVIGTSSVTVPAGQFQALVVAVTQTSGVTTDKYAPGVGLVSETTDLEKFLLSSYTP
jgi:hypothetical protein